MSENSEKTDSNKDPQKEESSPLEQAQNEATKWKTDLLYLKAEFDNYKKHAIKERADLLKFGSERIARDILEVVDNLERALSAKSGKDISPEVALQNLKTGIELIAKELKETLNKHGIQEIACEGQPFNPAIHEALSSEATSSVPEGYIARVFKKPYKMHDKIIRPGQVVVATAIKGDA